MIAVATQIAIEDTYYILSLDSAFVYECMNRFARFPI